MRFRNLSFARAFAAFALAASCQTIPAPPFEPGPVVSVGASGLDPGFLVVRQYRDFMGPVAVLANGSEFRLINEPVLEPAIVPLDPQIFDPLNQPTLRTPTRPPGLPGPDDDTASPGAQSALFDPADAPRMLNVNLPSMVSLRAQQTPIRRQHGDECTWFAATAAIEAAYNRDFGLDLDLSETHFNHLLKMALIGSGFPLPQRENQIGAWGGGHIHTNLSWMETSRAGLPPQSLHPNAPYKNYSHPNPGDVPDVMNWAAVGGATQRTFDDFNLRDTPFVMKTPEDLTWTPLPPGALTQGRYRSSGHDKPEGGEGRSLDWYREHLAAGREIVVQFACCDMFSNPEGRPGPSGAGGGSHAAILVGYDDAAQQFQMKNSWGENDFRPYHYDNITRGFVQAAAAITSVAPPSGPFPVIDNPSAFLGRWLLTDKGQPGLINGDAQGMLDIYNVPGPRTFRIGTFNAQDGSLYRVNGFLNGRVLTFWIDPVKPDLTLTDGVSGHRYQAMIFDDKRTIMTGRVAMGTGNFSRGFTARKIAPFSVAPVQRSAPPTPSTILKGYWSVEVEGELATLFFDRYDSSRNQFLGFFEVAGGTRGNAYGVVNGDGVTITSEQNTFRLYFTHFINDSKTALAGFFNGNPGTGIVAVLRHESAIVIPVLPGTLGPAADQP
jgi:hypothetical protein